MDAELKSRHVGLLHPRFHHLGILYPETARVDHSFIRKPHPGGMPADAAVAEKLGRSNPQPVIAETCADAEPDQPLERVVDNHHQIGANRQAAVSYTHLRAHETDS